MIKRTSGRRYEVTKLTFILGSFSLFPETQLGELIDFALEHNVYNSAVSLT